MEGEEMPEMAERGGSSIRSRERWLEALSYSELQSHVSPEKEGGQKTGSGVYIRGAVGLVPLVGHMSRGQGSPSAVEFVLSPLRIGFPIVLIEDNPVFAVLTQPTVCFDLENRFLSTGKEVKRRVNFQKHREIAPFLGQTALAMSFPRDGAVAGVATQPDPFVAAGAKDTVSLELSDIGVGAEEIDALLLRPLRPTFLSLGLRLDGRCADGDGGREGGLVARLR